MSANVVDGADRRIGDARMVVRVYERYSAMGGNRVSLSIAVLAAGQQLAVSAITPGGSQALFWKVNTFGEEAFMEKAKQALTSFTGGLPPAHGTENALLQGAGRCRWGSSMPCRLRQTRRFGAQRRSNRGLAANLPA